MMINLLLTMSSLAYPLVWLAGADFHWLLSLLPYLMALLWGLKAFQQAVKFQQVFAIVMAIGLLFIGFSRTLQTMYWYPVAINFMLLLLFMSSLWQEQSMIERLARLRTPELPPFAILYTRRVTQVWCGFFGFNILITSLFIMLEAYRYWAIYTGGIAYLLMGVLFVGEWIIRQFKQKEISQ